VFGCGRKVPIVSKVKKLWEYWLCCQLLQSAALCWLCQCPFYDICLTNVVVWKKEEDEITHTICLTNWVVWKKEEDDEITHNLFDKFGCEFGCERRKMMRSLTQFVWQIWLWIWLWEKEDDEITYTICLTNLVVNLVVREGRWWDHSHNLFDKFGCERKEDDEITYTLWCACSLSQFQQSSPTIDLFANVYSTFLYFTCEPVSTPPPVHPHQWRMNEWMNEW
jgi:hypothetical protein